MGRRRARCTWRCSTRGAACRRVVSLRCPDGSFPSVGAAASAGDPAGARDRATSSASRRRRAGHRGPGSITAAGGCARRSARRTRRARPGDLRVPAGGGRGLHQIPVGPVHAGIIEPGHFRFTANGETVVRLEERLGYVHKGIDGAAGRRRPRPRRRAWPARVSGDSTVAYALRLRPRRRGRARHRRRRRARPCCAA